MSYNIQHGVGLDGELNLKRIAAVIQDAAATVVGLQEVDRFYGERSQFKDQAKELATLLDCDYSYGPNVKIASQHLEFESSEYGIATLSRYPITSNEHLLLTSFGKEQRGVLKSTIDVNGQTINVYNTHLGLDSESRQAQVTELINMMSEDPRPSVLLGDFNAQPDSQEIQSLLEQTDLTDTFAQFQDAYSIPSDRPNRRIDYIFTSTSIVDKDQTVIQTEASDHLPIFTTSHMMD